MVMQDAVTVDLDASKRWYLNFHRDYRRWLEEEKTRLRTLRPNLLLSNIPYLSIEAAFELRIPRLALCSLHWGEILRAYFPEDREMLSVAEAIEEAYHRADDFLQPEPSIPMPKLGNTKPIGPIAQIGRNRQQEIKDRLDLPEEAKLALVALGGIPTTFDFEKWPSVENLCWLLPPEIKTSRSDARSFAELDFPFQDLIASSNLVITKIGYGTLVESVICGVPILCALRPCWPETEALASWCQRHGLFEAVEPEQLWPGAFAESLLKLLNAPPPSSSIKPIGVEEAADILREKLF